MASDFKWGRLIVNCVERLRDAGTVAVPFVDQEVMPPLDGTPSGIFVWFICDTIARKDQFRADALSGATRALRAMALESGFSPGAADSLRTDVTSLQEIERGGGRFYFFR